MEFKKENEIIILDSELDNLDLSSEARNDILELSYQMRGYRPYDRKLAQKILKSLVHKVDLDFFETDLAKVLFLGLYLEPAQEEILNLQEAHEESHAAKEHIIKAIEKGHLKALKINDDFLIKRGEFEEYMKIRSFL